MDQMIFYMPRNEEIYHENNLIENKHRFNVVQSRHRGSLSPFPVGHARLPLGVAGGSLRELSRGRMPPAAKHLETSSGRIRGRTDSQVKVAAGVVPRGDDSPDYEDSSMVLGSM